MSPLIAPDVPTAAARRSAPPTALMRRLAAAAALVGAALVGGTFARPAAAQRPIEVAPNAPKDQPLVSRRTCEWEATERAMAPYVARARATFPAARRRFDAGLPPKHTFFITTRLHDDEGHHEQVFVAVDSITGQGEQAVIAGRLASSLGAVRGYRAGQPLIVSAADLVDWMVARPDGSEEGNVVGKFLDTYTPPARCAAAAAGT